MNLKELAGFNPAFQAKLQNISDKGCQIGSHFWIDDAGNKAGWRLFLFPNNTVIRKYVSGESETYSAGTWEEICHATSFGARSGVDVQRKAQRFVYKPL